MTTIETTALVADDRRLVLQLPDDVSPGEHRVRVEVDPTLESEPAQDELTPVAWDGDVLVYGGEGVFAGDINEFIAQERDDRMRKIWGDGELNGALPIDRFLTGAARPAIKGNYP